jgi:ATP-dependent Clp protease protease subunit
MAEVFNIYCFGEIGWETNLSTILNQCQAAKDGDTVNVIINSPGGSVDEGFAIYDYLESLKGKGVTVNTEIYGMCASIATVIALAGESRIMTENSQFMIHNPWGAPVGDADEIQKYADSLKEIENRLANFYANKTGQKVDKLLALMASESYFTADQAKKLGFITEKKEASKAVAKLNTNKMSQTKPAVDKSIVAKIQRLFKALVDGEQPKALTTTLEDGTEVTIETEAAEPAVGDVVTVNGESAPDGSHTLADGSVIVTEGGVITEVVMASYKEDEEEMEALKAENSRLTAELETANNALKDFEAKLNQTTKAFAQQRKGFTPKAKPADPNAKRFTKEDLKK